MAETKYEHGKLLGAIGGKRRSFFSPCGVSLTIARVVGSTLFSIRGWSFFLENSSKCLCAIFARDLWYVYVSGFLKSLVLGFVVTSSAYSVFDLFSSRIMI